MRWIAGVLLVAITAAPLAQAHATPAGAEYEELVWQDGTFHQTYVQDGYDLHDLWMWEAYDPALGEGIMLRFHVYGGNTTGMYDTFRIQATLAVNGTPHAFAWWTADDATWQGDLPIQVVSSHTSGPLSGTGDLGGTVGDGVTDAVDQLPDEVAGPLGGVLDEVPDEPPVEPPVSPPATPDVGGAWVHEMRVFVPLSAIGAKVGDTVSGWIWKTTAERDGVVADRVSADVDVAPGGFWLTGAPLALPEQGPALPEPEGEPTPPSLAAEPISIFLQGPGRHLGASGQWADGKVAIRISNPYNATQQDVTVAAPAGAVAANGSMRVVAPGGEAVLVYDVPLQATAQHLVWDIMSDIGGHARLEVSLPAAPPPAPEPTASPTPAPAPSKPLERTDPTAAPPTADTPPIIREKDSPMGFLLVPLAAAVLLARRR